MHVFIYRYLNFSPSKIMNHARNTGMIFSPLSETIIEAHKQMNKIEINVEEE